MVIELTEVQFSMLLRPRKQKAFSSHIVHETEMMQYRASIVRFIKTQMTRFRS